MKGEKEKDTKKECIYCIKELAEVLGEATELGYKALSKKGLEKEEENQLIDILAATKGSMKLIEKLIANKSDISKDVMKKIEKKSDTFLEGLVGKEETKEEKAKEC